MRAEEASEVRGVAEAEVGGDGVRVPAGHTQEALSFEKASLIDDLAGSLPGRRTRRAAEGSRRASEQPGVLVRMVQFAEP